MIFFCKCLCERVKCHRFMALFLVWLPLSTSLLMCFPTLLIPSLASLLSCLSSCLAISLRPSLVIGRKAGRRQGKKRSRQSKQAGKEAGKEPGRQRGRAARMQAMGRAMWENTPAKRATPFKGTPRTVSLQQGPNMNKRASNVIVLRHRFATASVGS